MVVVRIKVDFRRDRPRQIQKQDGKSYENWKRHIPRSLANVPRSLRETAHRVYLEQRQRRKTDPKRCHRKNVNAGEYESQTHRNHETQRNTYGDGLDEIARF